VFTDCNTPLQVVYGLTILLFVRELTDLHETWYERLASAGHRNIYIVLARQQMPEIVM
jgi:hypothetical protein